MVHNIIITLIIVLSFIIIALISVSVTANHFFKTFKTYYKISFRTFLELYHMNEGFWQLSDSLTNPIYIDESDTNEPRSVVYFSTFDKLLYICWRVKYKNSIYNWHESNALDKFIDMLEYEEPSFDDLADTY